MEVVGNTLFYLYFSMLRLIMVILLNASKAFDLRHFGKLFRIVLFMDIPGCIIRLILDRYIRQRACVTWNSTKSQYFSIHNGVKQGGVISLTYISIQCLSGLGNHVLCSSRGVVANAQDSERAG